jgi:hypothetical protein
MDPTLEEKQNELPQQKRSTEGTISQGINTINNLARARRGFSNPFGKVGSRVVAQTALRGFAAFLAGPGLPIAIAIISVFIFTFIIVGFGGAPVSQTNQSANPTPAETVTPTPAL